MERRQELTNDTGRLRLLFVEVEGWDCWLKPCEAVELCAEVTSPTDQFVFTDNPDGVTVWPGGEMGIITVWQGGGEVEIGHQRPADWTGWPGTPTQALHPTA